MNEILGREESQVQQLFGNNDLLQHLLRYGDAPDKTEWLRIYEEKYDDLLSIKNVMKFMSIFNANLIQIQLREQIQLVHDSFCLEGFKEGCERIKRLGLEPLMSRLPSAEKIKEFKREMTAMGYSPSMIRDILEEDMSELEKLNDFYDRTQTRFFLDGADYDVNIFTRKEKCEDFTRKNRRNIITNPFNKNMRQVISFLVNEKQVQQYLITPRSKQKPRITTKYPTISKVNAKAIEKEIKEKLSLPIYKKLNNQSTMNMLKYMFYYMRSGIYVSIRNNMLHHFIPFVNIHYKNDWDEFIGSFFADYDGKEGDYSKPDETTYYGTKAHFVQKNVRGFRKENILSDTKKWYANGCLIGNEIPRGFWGDGMIPELIFMLKTLCLERKIPDVDFFINKKDFPTLKKDKTNPYHHILDRDDIPLRNYNYTNYAPVLGFNTTDNHADIAIPNMDDWRRMMKLHFANQCNGFANLENTTPWEERKRMAIFRGGATGCGTNVENNQRLKLAYISKNWRNEGKNIDGHPLLDAGLSTWAVRDKKKQGEPMRFVQPETDVTKFNKPWSVPLDLADYVPMDLQLQNKYVIYVDGNAAAYRYLTLMTTGSAILKVESSYGFKLWFYEELKGFDITSGKEGDIKLDEDGYDHIIVDANLENLEDVLRWCHDHDEECRIIAENAKEKQEKKFGYDQTLDYLQAVMVNISKNQVKDSLSKAIYNMKPEKQKVIKKSGGIPKTPNAVEVPVVEGVEAHGEAEDPAEKPKAKPRLKPRKKQKKGKQKKTVLSAVVDSKQREILKKMKGKIFM
jgi:hypothetical protein